MRKLSGLFKDRLAVAAAVLLVGLLAVSAFGTFFTVTGHNADLHRIALLSQKVYALEKTQAAQKAQLAKDIREVGTYAGQLVATIAADHGISQGDQRAICAAIPGCVLPSP